MSALSFSIDDELINEKIEESVNEKLEDLAFLPSIMNFKQIVKVLPFSKKRLYAVLRLYDSILDERNGGCVFYPGPGQSYLFRRKEFDQFVHDHWVEIITIDLDAYESDKIAYKASFTA